MPCARMRAPSARSSRQARNKGLEQISKTLDGVIRGIAEKRGLTLVLNKSLVVLAAENWDITTEVQKGAGREVAESKHLIGAGRS